MGTSGGFEMMCVEVGESLVKGESDQPNLEVNSEVTKNPKAQPEQGLPLQDWINSEIQSPMTENQLCMNEV